MLCCGCLARQSNLWASWQGGTQELFQPFNVKSWKGWANNSDTLPREPIARLRAAIKPVKRAINIEELREDPSF